MPSILPHIIAFACGTIIAVSGGVVTWIVPRAVAGVWWDLCLLSLVVGCVTMGVAFNSLRLILKGS